VRVRGLTSIHTHPRWKGRGSPDRHLYNRGIWVRARVPGGPHLQPVDVLLAAFFDRCDLLAQPEYTLILVRSSLRDSARETHFADTVACVLEKCREIPLPPLILACPVHPGCRDSSWLVGKCLVMAEGSAAPGALTRNGNQPQRAITPGQAPAFYHGDEVPAGGGWNAQVVP